MPEEQSVFLVSIIFHIRLTLVSKFTVFFTENVMQYYAHVQTVSTRPLFRGGEWPGDEVMYKHGEGRPWTFGYVGDVR